MRSIEKKAGNRSFGAKASGGVSGGAAFISRPSFRARVSLEEFQDGTQP